jgi:hypothetical protein
MGQATKESGCKINITDLEPKNGQMDLGLKASTSMAKSVARDSLGLLMEESTRVNLQITRLKAEVPLDGQTAESTLEAGKTIRCMEMANFNGQTPRHNILEGLSMTSAKDTVSISTTMVGAPIEASGEMTNNMELAMSGVSLNCTNERVSGRMDHSKNGFRTLSKYLKLLNAQCRVQIETSTMLILQGKMRNRKNKRHKSLAKRWLRKVRLNL